MDEKNKNKVISILVDRLAKASALVDELDAVDANDIRAAGLVFCDLGELFYGLAIATAQSAVLVATELIMPDAE